MSITKKQYDKINNTIEKLSPPEKADNLSFDCWLLLLMIVDWDCLKQSVKNKFQAKCEDIIFGKD